MGLFGCFLRALRFYWSPLHYYLESGGFGGILGDFEGFLGDSEGLGWIFLGVSRPEFFF